MKKYWQAVGITLAVAGALVYPAIKLYQYMTRRKKEGDNKEDEKTHHIKSFLPAFRGKRKHHRTEHNGNAEPGMGLA